MNNEILFIIGSVAIIIIGILLTNLISSKVKIDFIIARKFLHFTAGILSTISLFIVNELYVLLIISSIILIILILLYYNNKWGKYYLKVSNGMIYFTISFIVLLLVFGKNGKDIIAISMLIMGLSDSVAAISGRYLLTGNFTLNNQKKTIWGSLSFFFTTFCILLVVPLYTQTFFALTFNLGLNLIVAFILALQLTIIEGMSSNGKDNLFVPLYSAIFLFLLVNPINTIIIDRYVIGVILSLIVVAVSIKARFLTFSGGTATFLLANTVYGLGGIKWTIPIFTFFLLSSLLSKIKSLNKEKAEMYYEKTGVRDHKQVLANGGIAGFLVILNSIDPNELFFMMYVVFLATVCSDTWSTEIGTLVKSKTYSIVNFKQVNQGVSGGISLLGTIGGISGAIIIILVSSSFTNFTFNKFFLIILISSFLGNIFDSLVGGILQAEYTCTVCAKNTEKEEHCGKKSIHTKGIKFINNDFVNFVAGFFSISVSLIIYNIVFN